MSKERSSRRAPIMRKVTGTLERSVKSDEGSAESGEKLQWAREEYREQTRTQVFAAWPQILQGLIEKARGGAYQHTKLLLDLCEMAAKQPQRSDESPNEQLCDALLNNLQLRPPE